MAQIPAGYDPTALAPKIEIIDENDIVRYTYESPSISPSPIQDFDLESWSLHRGVNTDHGNCVLIIDDPNKDLLDLTTPSLDSKIIGTWKVRLYLGKNSSNIHEWFRGFILGIDTDFPNVSETKHRLFVAGEGIKTSYYKTVMRFFQKKLDDSETLDTLDSDAKISEIFKRLILNTDHYATAVDPLGFGVSGVMDIDIKIPDFQKNFDSIGQALNELAQWGACYYGIDIGEAYLRTRSTVDSSFLVTNMDYNSVTKDNWDQDKVSYLINSPRGWKSDMLDYGVAFFNGLNIQKPIIDQEQNLEDSQFDLSAFTHAFSITPTRDNVLKIAPFLSKTGTITKDLVVKIIGDNNGVPNPEDVRITKIIKGKQLESELTIGKYFEILFNKFPIVPGSKLYCFFEEYIDAVNKLEVSYQSGGNAPAGKGFFISNDGGINWLIEIPNSVKFKEYAAKTVHVLCENTVASKKFSGMQRQINVPMINFKSNQMALVALAGIAVSRGVERRQYPTFQVSAPTKPLELAKTFRFIDIRSGLEFSPNLISYDLGGNAYDKESNLGAKEVTLTIEEWRN